MKDRRGMDSSYNHPDCSMTHIGVFTGRAGRERLSEEINKILSWKEKAVIAVEGLPGSGKTHLMKHIVRFGFGRFSGKEIAVIDDNTLYSTNLWKLHWKKLTVDKSSWKSLVNGIDARIVFFSNWVPSRFIDFADILVRLRADDDKRIGRLQRRYKKQPEKVDIQKVKTNMPVEPPFVCGKVIVLNDPCHEMVGWEMSWLMRRFCTGIKGK